MTAVSTHPGRATGTRRGLPLVIGHQFHADLRCYLRNTQSVVFTIFLPVIFLVLLASIFRNQTVSVPGGTMKVSVYYVPGLIAYGVITAAFSNLALSVVRNREAGIYKRRRATPLPASAVIASRAAVAVLTALAIGAVYMISAAIAAASPTPGGVGAIEAALAADLTGIGISPGAAVAAVITYRLATYWLPVPPGWLAWRLLHRMDYA